MEISSIRCTIALVAALAVAGCQTLTGIHEASVAQSESLQTTPMPAPGDVEPSPKTPKPWPTTPMPAPSDVEPACRFKTPLKIYGPPVKAVRVSPEDEDWKSRRCKKFQAVVATLVEIAAEGTPLAIPVPSRQDAFRTGLRATLTGRLFNHGENRLRESAAADIGRLADGLYRDGRTGLVIVGHADASGSMRSNFDLSHKRAIMVAKIFVRFGILPDRITVVGRGETQPIAGNETEEGRALNRRIEILEYPDGELPVELVAGAHRPMSLPEAIADERRAAEIAVAAARNARDATSTKRHAVMATLRTEASPINFGGEPVAQPVDPLAALVGAIDEQSIWNRLNPFRMVRASNTTENLDLACIAAKFQDSTFQDGLVREDNTSDLSGPWVSKLGLYGTAWTGSVNGQQVTLADMAVLAKGTPETAPTLYVHRQYEGGSADAEIKALGASTASIGEEGLLYRAYFEEDAWPVRCIDLVFDRNNPGTFRHGRLYYENNGRIYAATYKPEFVKN